MSVEKTPTRAKEQSSALTASPTNALASVTVHPLIKKPLPPNRAMTDWIISKCLTR